jgi:hypothetical protein
MNMDEKIKKGIINGLKIAKKNNKLIIISKVVGLSTLKLNEIIKTDKLNNDDYLLLKCHL